jgi:hypothetical protein
VSFNPDGDDARSSVWCPRISRNSGIQWLRTSDTICAPDSPGAPMTTHARRYHLDSGTTGHVGQGRFKSFPVQDDDHFLTVLRYLERKALRSEDWK